MDNYCINPKYQVRHHYNHFDDRTMTDEFQDDVYLFAVAKFYDRGFKTVLDIGCGSGFKLMKYFNEYETTGTELEINVNFLKEKYPDKNWIVSDFSETLKDSYDLIICSDVIEHLLDPDMLINYIKRTNFKYLIISTPDRGLDSEMAQYGPPENIHHIREWNYKEFENYISKHFYIFSHVITNRENRTQTIFCRNK